MYIQRAESKRSKILQPQLMPFPGSQQVVFFAASEQDCPFASTKLNCLASEAHESKQLAQSHYMKV